MSGFRTPAHFDPAEARLAVLRFVAGGLALYLVLALITLAAWANGVVQ